MGAETPRGTAGLDAGLLSPVWAGTGHDTALDDTAWVGAMVEVEIALARAQARLGVIPADAATAIHQALRSTTLDVADIARRSREAANPIVPLVHALVEVVGDTAPEAADYVHRGSTSQDILDSAAVLLAARTLARVRADLSATATALAALAERHRDTPMAGRTLTQHAVPVTFGLKAAGWLALVLDAAERVTATADALPAQLGGAAGTLAAYLEYAAPADPAAHAAALTDAFAAELGLRPPDAPWHGGRTPFVDIGHALAVTTGALGKFALDVQGMSRTEVDEVAEPFAEGRGASSAMPQKRNPVLATLIVTAARQVPAYVGVLYQSMLAEDERSAGAWHAEWQPLREALRLTGGAAHTAVELAEGLQVHPERLRENLGQTGGAIVSERLGVVLAPLLGKAEAKSALTRLLRESAASGRRIDDLLADLVAARVADSPELAAVAPDPAAVRDLLRPEHYLGAAGPIVDHILARHAATTATDAP